MTLKDNSAREILIAAIIIVALQSGIVTGMALHNHRISEVEGTVDRINKNFVPTFLMEGIIKNMNYQTEEIVATIKCDKEEVKKINAKYLDFQRTMLDNLAQMRGGISNITRSATIKRDTSK